MKKNRTPTQQTRWDAFNAGANSLIFQKISNKKERKTKTNRFVSYDFIYRTKIHNLRAALQLSNFNAVIFLMKRQNN